MFFRLANFYQFKGEPTLRKSFKKIFFGVEFKIYIVNFYNKISKLNHNIEGFK